MKPSDLSCFQQSIPEYGASSHYLGQAGAAYFASQKQSGELSAVWNSRIWEKHVRADDTLLDFGCGGGYLLNKLNAARKVGVEINPIARRQAKVLGLEVFSTLDDVPPILFSRIISNHSVEHVPCPVTALRQLRDFLAPDGEMNLLLPLDDWRSRAHRAYRPSNLHRHLYSWTPQNLGNLLEEAGYGEISISIIKDAMPPSHHITSALLKLPSLRVLAGRVLSSIMRRYQLFARANLKNPLRTSACK
jgi:SAM-dependent methyltransferase